MAIFIKLAVTSIIFVVGSNVWFKHDTDAFEAKTTRKAPFWSGVVLIASCIIFIISIIGIIWSM